MKNITAIIRTIIAGLISAFGIILTQPNSWKETWGIIFIFLGVIFAGKTLNKWLSKK